MKRKSNTYFWSDSKDMPVDVCLCAAKRCLNDAEEGRDYCSDCIAKKTKPERKYRLTAKPGYTWVYFVECANFIKIGRATNPRLRVGGMQTGCPLPIKFLVAFEGRAFLEKEMQESFSDCHHRGEWFSANDDLYDFIGALKKGAAVKISGSATGRVLLPEKFYSGKC
jgi:hypothetical protein